MVLVFRGACLSNNDFSVVLFINKLLINKFTETKRSSIPYYPGVLQLTTKLAKINITNFAI